MGKETSFLQGKDRTLRLFGRLVVRFGFTEAPAQGWTFREDSQGEVIGHLPGLSNKGVRFLSGSFCPSHSRDKPWDQPP